MSRLCVAAMLFLVTLLAAARAADIDRGRILEGKGVAGVRLGMTAAEVKRKLGAPESANHDGAGNLLFMSYHASQNFGVYIGDENRVRMIIVSVEGGGFCTSYKACLYREGGLSKIKARHGSKLLRFADVDGSITYRLLTKLKGRPVLTEWTPVKDRDGVVQVAMLYWEGPIDRSSFD